MELIYIERDGNPVTVAADVVTRHPNQTITFCITSPEWKTRIGWNATSHVEVQAEPTGQANRPDRYYWVDPLNDDIKGRQTALREFLELYSEAPDSYVDLAFTKALKGALASSQEVDWPRYAWNMLDLLIHSAGGCTSAVAALEIVLVNGFPETAEVKAKRRDGLTMRALEIA